jgi:transcriptional activator of cad operon
MNGLCFQINGWTLIVEENKLYRQGREVAVEPRLVNLLSFLAGSPGEVFCREELIDNVWAGAIVTDQVVTQSIFELRKILKDGRVDCDRYIATVPKRGYKLVAETTPLTPDEASAAKLNGVVPKNTPAVITQTSEFIDKFQSRSESDQAINIFPAAPLTRAITNFSQHLASEEAKHEKKLTLYQRYKLQIFDMFLLTVLIIVIILCGYIKSPAKITKAMDVNVVEFSYHVSQNSDLSSEYLADGISQKLMSDVSTLGDYRVQLKKTVFTTGILPGKSVSVRIDSQQGKSYLDVKYRNNTSNRIIFSRQYLISDNALYTSLRQASKDLMLALAITPTTQQLDLLMSGLPIDSVLLTKLIKANHYINQIDLEVFKKGISLLEKVLEANPDNGLVLAERYIAYNVLSALSPELDLVNNIKQSSDALLASHSDAVKWQRDNSVQLLPVRVYEAFALQAIQNDRVIEAKHFITIAGKYRRSALYFILQGKLAELDGDLDRAGDAYTQAFYIDTSIETFKLSQNLAFYSNIETIARFMHRAVNPTEIKLI